MKANKLTKETINRVGVTAKQFPEFTIGDSIALSQWIIEGDKKRLQVFEGDVIAFHHNGVSTTFTVRKIGANNVAVERIYPYYSPVIESISVVRHGRVRRAKLFYLRDRMGKSRKIKELILTKEQKVERLARDEKRAADRKTADTEAAS